MELDLSLGSPPVRPSEKITGGAVGRWTNTGLKLGFCRVEEEKDNRGALVEETRVSADPPVQLNLLPLAHSSRHGAPQMGFPWAAESTNLEPSERGFDVNRMPLSAGEAQLEEASSPNSAASSFQMNLAGVGGVGGAAPELEAERSSSRASDDDEDCGARKKLRLSREQSAFLEERFKEHSTLNPKQKLALAKQLNLRPRQVEVWFQNRRARTKLKQTEVDCEYLKHCCEALTEENRRLQKELSELRALKTSHPFFMQLPATTLSICSSCDRAPKSSVPSASAAAAAISSSGKPAAFFSNTR